MHCHELIDAYMEEQVFQFQEVELDDEHLRCWGRLNIIRQTKVTLDLVDADSEGMLVTQFVPVDYYAARYIMLESCGRDQRE